MPGIVSDLDEKATEVEEILKYSSIVSRSRESIRTLFEKLDVDGSGWLDKSEVKEVVAKYKGEAFDEAQFLGWFDVHGVRRRTTRRAPAPHMPTAIVPGRARRIIAPAERRRVPLTVDYVRGPRRQAGPEGVWVVPRGHRVRLWRDA